MTESWEKELIRLRKGKEEDENAQAVAKRIEGELPEIRGTGNVAIMTPTRPRKGGEKS